MRRSVALLLGLLATAAAAAPDPRKVPTQLDPAWQVTTRALFEQVIEIPTVHNRGEVPRMAKLIAGELEKGGFPASDIKIMPYEALPGDNTAALIFRWRADKPTKKPMLLLGHMDVVEAKREDWKYDPFEFREKGGYFYGRGTSDMKNGIVAMTEAILKLKAARFKPDRDIIMFLSGDGETMSKGAALGSTEWRKLTDAEFGLNADGVCNAGGGRASYDRNFRALGCGISHSIATQVDEVYLLTAHNPGGYSSRALSDNAMADALKALQAHRFTPMLNYISRDYFEEWARQEDDSALGRQIRAWLANPDDGAAADAIEANLGRTTRTRCVATLLNADHADNALPQVARASVDCRIIPGVDSKSVQAELQQLVGPKIDVVPYPNFIGDQTPDPPVRRDVLEAMTAAIQRFHGPAMDVYSLMAAGASDGSSFRAAGIPVYDVDGSWGIAPDDERAHGLNERIPVRAMYDDVLHWEMMLRDLAGK